MSGSWEKTQCDLSPLPPLFPSFSPSSLPQLNLTVAYDLAEQRRLYSYFEASVDYEELLSIVGEKKGLVLWVDQNRVVYITVVPLGTLEKWEVNFTFSPSSLIHLRWVTSVAGCWSMPPALSDIVCVLQ